MANIGYIQVVRHCNHLCGFCSNPTTPYVHTFDSMKVLVDDFVARGYFGIILTGGEPTLHPELPAICRYARDSGLHVRMITNGSRLSDPAFARDMAEAGLHLVHVSVYSVRPEVEAQLRGLPGTLPAAFGAVSAAHDAGIEVNINCVINKLNADHLDENIRYWNQHHPYVNHFVWNNLDPSMGRAEVNQEAFLHRLSDFELSLVRALSLLQRSGRTFRVEKVPLCYMTDFAWASTETRKIVKGEERIVHFLDAKQTVRQTDWSHLYNERCGVCSLRTICGGLFDRGEGYDPAELHPVFVNRDTIVRKILFDGQDPASHFPSFKAWHEDFEARLCAQQEEREGQSPEQLEVERKRRNSEAPGEADSPGVGQVTARGQRLYESKRRAEGRRVAERGLSLEHEEKREQDPGSES